LKALEMLELLIFYRCILSLEIFLEIEIILNSPRSIHFILLLFKGFSEKLRGL
jgi:hypothetical protein